MNKQEDTVSKLIDMNKQEDTVSKLIDAWIRIHQKPCPWKIAVEIVAIVQHLPEEEKQRLLALDT